MRLLDDISTGDVRSTTTFRLAILLGVLFCCGVIALGGLIYGITTRELTARSDQILHNEADWLLRFPPGTLASQIALEVERDLRGLNKFALLSSRGTFLTGDISPPPGLTPENPIDVEAGAGQSPMRILAVRVSNGEIILLGRDITEIRFLEQHILIAIVLSCLSIIPSVLLIGTALSFQPLRRLHQLQDVAKRVAAGQFSLRMPQAGRGDAIDQIAVTVNTMIEDVGRIVEQVKNVTDAIAHDLRTPLARVRSRLEDLRARNTAWEEPPDTIGELIGDLDIVLDRFAALLRISELEARDRRSGFQPVLLAPLVLNVFELYQPLAEDANIDFRIRNVETVRVYADRNLLFEALSNLVDNAIKFGRKTISISVWKEKSTAVIKIQDDGPGIPNDECDAVLRRFYRRPGKSNLPGSGLGLSVVTAILHLHRFKLELADAKPGLAAKIFIPLGSEQM